LLERIRAERARKGAAALRPNDAAELPALPAGWKWVKVGDIAWVTKLAGFEFTKFFKYQESGPVRVIRALNVGFGEFKARNFHFIDSSISDALPRSQLHGGELLIAYVGTLGSAAILPKDGNRYHLGPNVGKVVIDKVIDDAKPLMYFLLSSIGQQMIHATSKAVTQSSLSMEQIRNFIVPLAPLAEQKQIVAEVERRLSVADEVEHVVDASLKQAERLRQSILKRAFAGKLVPQDPSDEPAERLVERIRAARSDREGPKHRAAQSQRKKSQ